MEELTSYLSDLNCKKETYCFLGDINIDFAKVNNSTAITDLLNSPSCSGGLSLINISTRVTKSSATIIDHIFTNDVSHSLHAGVIRSDLSNHFPIFCKVGEVGLLLTKKGNNQQFRLYRDKYKFSSENFHEELTSQLEVHFENEPALDVHNFNTSYQFIEIINKTIDQHASLKRFSRKHQKLKSKP